MWRLATKINPMPQAVTRPDKIGFRATDLDTPGSLFRVTERVPGGTPDPTDVEDQAG